MNHMSDIDCLSGLDIFDEIWRWLIELLYDSSVFVFSIV